MSLSSSIDRKENPEEEKIVVDNPGKGSCASYALVPHLRKEIIENKTEDQNSLFQSMLPKRLLPPQDKKETNVEQVKRERKLEHYKAELKKDILCFQYKEKYNFYKEFSRAAVRIAGGIAAGLDPLLHKADKLFRQQLVDIASGKIANNINNNEGLRKNEDIKRIICVFNHFYRGEPKILSKSDITACGPLYSQIKKSAQKFKLMNTNGTYPDPTRPDGSPDNNGNFIQDVALFYLMAYIASPKQVKSLEHLIKNNLYPKIQFYLKFEESSAIMTLLSNKKSFGTYIFDDDVEKLAKSQDIAINIRTKSAFGGEVSRTTEKGKKDVILDLNFIESPKGERFNHWNNLQSKQEFNLQNDRAALFSKFGKYTDFKTYPDLRSAEIRKILQEST